MMYVFTLETIMYYPFLLKVFHLAIHNECGAAELEVSLSCIVLFAT